MAEVRASQGSIAVARAPAAGQRAAQRAVVPGEDQRHGEAVQQLGHEVGVVAPAGVFEGLDRLVLTGPPAGGHAVQLGRPPQALTLQISQQVRAQELLDAVGVALPSGGRHERGAVFEPVEQAARVVPPRQLHGEPRRDRID